MRALIVNTTRQITPFLEPPGEALYGSTTVGASVRALLAARGLDVVTIDADEPVPAGPGPVVVLADHCFVTEKALGDFLGRAFDVVVTQKKSARLALAKSPSVQFTLPLSSATTEPFDADGPGAAPPRNTSALQKHEMAASERVAYDCFFVDDVTAATGGALLERLRHDSVRVVVPKGELGIPVRMPTLGDGAANIMLLPVTSTLCVHVQHWAHILWLNQAAFGTRWLEVARAHKLWCAWRLLTTFPWRLSSLMHRFVRTGKNARIHPTAWVEASIIGDDVVIGAKASVRNCVIGSGVVVGDHATVLGSTLADRVTVTPRTFVVSSAAYPDAVLSNYKLQVSLIGRGASLSTWAGFIDAKLQGAVDVMHDGALRSTERSFLGSCLGHGAHVGAKVLILPGREIPNGAFVVMRDDELIREIPVELPRGVPLVRDQGRLVPLASAAPTGASGTASSGPSTTPSTTPSTLPGSIGS